MTKINLHKQIVEDPLILKKGEACSILPKFFDSSVSICQTYKEGKPDFFTISYELCIVAPCYIFTEDSRRGWTVSLYSCWITLPTTSFLESYNEADRLFKKWESKKDIHKRLKFLWKYKGWEKKSIKPFEFFPKESPQEVEVFYIYSLPYYLESQFYTQNHLIIIQNYKFLTVYWVQERKHGETIIREECKPGEKNFEDIWEIYKEKALK